MGFDGFVLIGEKRIPYSFDNEEITLFFGSLPDTVPDGLDVLMTQHVECMTSKCTMFKLATPLQNDCILKENGSEKAVSSFNQVYAVDFRIENYGQDSKYTKMCVSFPELDYFCPSEKMCNVYLGKAEFIRCPICAMRGAIRYRGTDVIVELGTSASIELKAKASAKTETKLVLTFPETSDFSYITGLYHAIKNFFCFVCNRQNIALHQVVLIGDCLEKRMKDKKLIEERRYLKSRFIPVEKYIEPDESIDEISETTRYECYKTHFIELLQMFFERELGENALVGASAMHASVKYRNFIDLKQSLHITAAFEYYVRTILPEMHSQEAITFYNEMSTWVDKFIEENSGDLKKRAKKFKKKLSPYMSLSEKLQKVIDGYSGWEPIKPALKDWFGNDYASLANVANDWRNELAHEKRTYEPDINTVDAVRLVEHLNYSIILRKAGYNTEEISNILENTLVR